MLSGFELYPRWVPLIQGTIPQIHGEVVTPTQATEARSVIWITWTSPLALFLITVPFSRRNVVCRLECWKFSAIRFWLYTEISTTAIFRAVRRRNIVARIFELRHLQMTY